jgi:hypothetical protein
VGVSLIPGEAPAGTPLAVPAAGRGDWTRPVLAAALAVALVAVVYAVLFPNLRYGEHDISDVVIYQYDAQLMAAGQQPYRDFDFEYPPLAAYLFALPGHSASYADYTQWFSFVMFVLTALGGAAVAAAAARLWPDNLRPFLAAALYAAAVAAVGTIVENRFDIAVGLVEAVVILLLARRQVVAAAAVVGLGFALKLTPAVLLPLVLLLAPSVRRALWAGTAFLFTAATPFVPYLVLSPRGVWHIFAYHLARPLQIESVPATPFLVGKTLGWVWVDITTTFGSQAILATGAGAAAAAGTYLTAAALLLVLLLIARRRALLRAAPRYLPLAALSVVLALMTFGKVLSPQYLVWLVPLAALVVIEDVVLGALVFATLLLTQINFPAKYWGLVYLDPSSIHWLAVRNAALVVTLAVSVWRLARLPGEAPATGRGAVRLPAAAPLGRRASQRVRDRGAAGAEAGGAVSRRRAAR